MQMEPNPMGPAMLQRAIAEASNGAATIDPEGENKRKLFDMTNAFNLELMELVKKHKPYAFVAGFSFSVPHSNPEERNHQSRGVRTEGQAPDLVYLARHCLQAANQVGQLLI